MPLISVDSFFYLYSTCLSIVLSLLRSRSGRSHVTLPVPTRLLQTDIHSFLGVLRFCLLGPMSLSFSCHCIRCTNHMREHSQQNESHTLIGLFPRKECMSVWSSRVGTGSVTWLRPERLRRRLYSSKIFLLRIEQMNSLIILIRYRNVSRSFTDCYDCDWFKKLLFCH